MRLLKKYLGLFLLVLTSLGMTLSTLHSHHDFQWHKTEQVADTGTSISSDGTACPICGYLFKVDLPLDGNNVSVFFQGRDITTNLTYSFSLGFEITTPGRSPPFLV
ncbi:MAG: hypothetical protein R3281_18415 [Balneolaceae bacterium]|nr:hypothetical protein [Balneolaceae bacterium]